MQEQCPKTWPLDKIKSATLELTPVPLVIPAIGGRQTRDDDAVFGHINLPVRLDPYYLSPPSKDAKGINDILPVSTSPQLSASCVYLGAQEATPVLRSLGSTQFLVLQVSWPSSSGHSLICLCPFSSVRFKTEHKSLQTGVYPREGKTPWFQKLYFY